MNELPTEIIHKHKSFGVTECGKNIKDMGPNQKLIMTVVKRKVTCPKCKEVLNNHEQPPKNI